VKRIFTFGCSLTSYEWPSWADALCLQYHLEEGCETYNYGSLGMGNEHVVQALAAADLKHKFTEDDIICVLWSSWLREDRIWNDKTWGHHGNVLNSKVSVTFAKDHFSLENYIMKNITAIHSANKAYNINFQGNTSQVDDVGTVVEGDDLLNTFNNMDHSSTANVAFSNADRAAFIKSNNNIDPVEIIRTYDGHPCPLEHLAYLKDKVLPELGIKHLNPKVEMWMQDWQNRFTKLNDNIGLIKNKPMATGAFYDTIAEFSELIMSETSSYQDRMEDLWETNKGGPTEKGIHSMLQRHLGQK
jgi:hypothetical protein